jgi:hypothetical protein
MKNYENYFVTFPTTTATRSTPSQNQWGYPSFISVDGQVRSIKWILYDLTKV